MTFVQNIRTYNVDEIDTWQQQTTITRQTFLKSVQMLILILIKNFSILFFFNLQHLFFSYYHLAKLGRFSCRCSMQMKQGFKTSERSFREREEKKNEN